METDADGHWSNKLWLWWRSAPIVVKTVYFILFLPLVIFAILLLAFYVVYKFLFYDIPLFCLLWCGCRQPKREPIFGELPVHGNYTRNRSADPVIVINQTAEDGSLPEGANMSPPDYTDVVTKVSVFVIDESDGEQPPPTYLEAAEGRSDTGSLDIVVSQERY